MNHDGADPVGSAREEAERLVALALASVSVAANRVGYHVEEGCGCPVCRAILLLRDPDPEVAARLADGAGELAAGAAELLRTWRGRRVPGQRAD